MSYHSNSNNTNRTSIIRTSQCHSPAISEPHSSSADLSSRVVTRGSYYLHNKSISTQETYSMQGSFDESRTTSMTTTNHGSEISAELLLLDETYQRDKQQNREPAIQHSRQNKLKHNRDSARFRCWNRKRKTRSNQAEIIISHSKRQWLWRIVVHLLPLTAGIIVAAINMRGYFVGTQFAGVTDVKTQPIALLALQTTAKLFEVSVVLSLGLVVLEVVQHFLLFDNSGLPMTLSGISLTFSNLVYLFRPSYWSGIAMFNSWKTRISIGLLLLSCGLIANLIGPSTALLLIPSYTSVWPAGGFRFRIPLPMDQLFPQEMNTSHISAPWCIDPAQARVQVPSTDDCPCIWFDASNIGSRLSQTNDWLGNFTVGDQLVQFGGLDRSISWAAYSPGGSSFMVWSWSGMSIASAISAQLYSYWAMAAPEISPGIYQFLGVQNRSWSSLSEYYRYSHRDPTGTRMELSMPGPIARTVCKVQYTEFNSPLSLLYPVLPLYSNFDQDTNDTYRIATSLKQNASQVIAQWVPKPAADSSVDDPQQDLPSTIPSAFLVIQIPSNSTSEGGVLSCSIDARWANLTLANQADYDETWLPITGLPRAFGGTRDAFLDDQGRPLMNRTSNPIQLNLAWLNQLTPAFNETGFNSLSSALQNSELLKSHPTMINDQALDDWLENWAVNVEDVVSMLVVAGLTRHNLFKVLGAGIAFTTNDGNLQVNVPAWLAAASLNPLSLLFRGGGTDQIPYNSSQPPNTYSEFVWTISISGYGYATTCNIASVLALGVLLSYIALAVGHITFLLFKRWSSSTWDSIPEIITLCQNSPYSAVLEKSSRDEPLDCANRPLLKLRACESLVGDREKTVHVLVGLNQKSSSSCNSTAYHMIEKDEKYR